MARVTIIDIPDHQVDAVLRAVQALSGGAPTPPPMVVEFPRVLPAPEPPAEPASAEPDPPAAPVRHPNRAKRQAVAAKGPRAKKLQTVGLTDQLLAVLPGTTEDIARKSGYSHKQVYQNLYWLRKKGRVVKSGDVWSAASGRAAPRPVGKRQGVNGSAESAAEEKLKTTVEVFLEALATGPHTTRELWQSGVSAGKQIPDVGHAERILMQMERREQVVRQADGRWALGKGGRE